MRPAATTTASPAGRPRWGSRRSRSRRHGPAPSPAPRAARQGRRPHRRHRARGRRLLRPRRAPPRPPREPLQARQEGRLGHGTPDLTAGGSSSRRRLHYLRVLHPAPASPATATLVSEAHGRGPRGWARGHGSAPGHGGVRAADRAGPRAHRGSRLRLPRRHPLRPLARQRQRRAPRETERPKGAALAEALSTQLKFCSSTTPSLSRAMKILDSNLEKAIMGND